MASNRLLFACVAILLLPSAGEAQIRRGDYPAESPSCDTLFGQLKRTQENQFPDYRLQRLPAQTIDTLRHELHAHCWRHALATYFPYVDSRKVDWIVYLDGDDAHQATTRGARWRKDFRGEKFVWLLAFTDGPLCAHTDTAADLVFSRRSLDYRSDPFLKALVNAIATKFFAAPTPATPSVVADSTLNLKYESLATGGPIDLVAHPEGDNLCVAQGRVSISDNTQIILSLRAGSGKQLPGTTRSVYNYIGNAAPSLWEIGLAFGGSRGPRIPTIEGDSVVGTKAGFQPNVYVTTYLNLVRPSLPWRRGSFGLMLGTNIVRGGLLDDLLTGVAAGRVIGDAGFVAGADWMNVQYARPKGSGGPPLFERRRPRVFAAFDFRL